MGGAVIPLRIPPVSTQPDLYHGKWVAGLFAAGEQGAWFDPSDLSTLYQDAVGTTPVTAVEQPIGLWLDKSKGLVLGSELVTNGTFDTNIDGWTYGSEYSNISFNSGKLRVATTSTTTQGKSAYQPFPVVAGKTYKISGRAIVVEGTFTVVQVALRDGTSSATSALIATTVVTMDGGVEYSFIYTATTTTTLYLHCRIFNTTAPATVDYDDISAKELPGNHAIQATTASRPRLQQDSSGKYYLSFDGVDDSLVTGSIDFTATDKMTVLAGLRKLSDAALGVVAELSASVAANTGVFALTAPASAGANIGFSSKGTTEAGNVATGVPAPASQVIAGLASIDLPLNRLRINQVTAETTASQGGGRYGNYPLYIGRRGGTSLPFNGRLYGLIVRGAQTDDDHLTHAEKYLAYKSGVTL